MQDKLQEAKKRLEALNEQAAQKKREIDAKAKKQSQKLAERIQRLERMAREKERKQRRADEGMLGGIILKACEEDSEVAQWIWGQVKPRLNNRDTRRLGPRFLAMLGNAGDKPE